MTGQNQRYPSPHESQVFTLLLQKAQMKWVGHVMQMPDKRIPKQMMYGELDNSKQLVGWQKNASKAPLKCL
uniref:Uncharacterized protein n=1 Tax=Arion vulgaris TaxID=1028688 RepID=A0A0B7ANU2_9EUPU